MTSHGVILYGPPASGKDTVTRELTRLDPRIAMFQRLKVGPAPMATYRPISHPDLDQLVAAGQIAWSNDRYGTTYAVDTPALIAHLAEHVSVLHLGQVQAVDAIRAATPDTAWLVVELWCARDVAEQRVVQRGSTDVTDRLAAWDATEHLPTADHRVDTGQVPAQQTARRIVTWLGLTSRT
jgi:guanylate kinase